MDAANWRMSDIAAAAVLMSWECNWDTIAKYMVDHDDEVVDVGPFKRGAKGSIMNCLMEVRQERPGIETKCYYYPMASRSEAPEAWRFFDAHHCLELLCCLLGF